MGRSGKNNPYTQILGEDYLINAEGFEAKRTKTHQTKPAFSRWIKFVRVSEIRFYNESPCWEWLGCKQSNGYGQFRIDGRRGAKKSSPHRFAWEFFYEVIPGGYEIDHLCCNRSCVSPFHLEAVTLQENRKRRNESITHCKNDHELNADNAQMVGNLRKCRICNRERVKAFYERKRLKMGDSV